MKIIANKELSALNTFGISSIANQYSEVHNVNELVSVEDFDDVFILGGGSNVLLPDRIDKWVWHNKINFIRVDELGDEVIVHVGGGLNWHDLVTTCVHFGWGGLENLALIPGQVGAAPVQNIGAYGVELQDVFVSLEAYHLTSGTLEIFSHEACEFEYRNSVFKQALKGQYIITSVTFKLTARDHAINTSYYALSDACRERNILNPTIQDIYNLVIDIRMSKLPDPDQLGNGGSFFKNPIINLEQWNTLHKEFPELKHFSVNGSEHVKLAAGQLIDLCGWKGRRIGDVGCYEKQALVIVNFGKATSKEIKSFAHEIQASVNQKFGITLEPEVNIIEK